MSDDLYGEFWKAAFLRMQVRYSSEQPNMQMTDVYSCGFFSR